MRFPTHIVMDSALHTLKHALKRTKRYPYVLMLEPLYTCNLACLGCSTERHTGKLKDRVSPEQCFQAIEESGAPQLSICGGEPTLYPELKELIEGMIARKKHIFLCTNALLLDKNVFGKIAPHKRLTINVHLDGLAETHDYVCAKQGVYDKALAMIKEAKRLGYHVWTNTTVFKETNIDEVETLCRLLSDLKVDGMLVAPGYQYESVDRDMFLTRDDIHIKFQRVLELSKKYRLTSTPMFLEFAAGLRDYKCSPWSTVTYTPLGWKGPCYLIGEKYFPTWNEFWTGVDWDYWESRKDRRCANCKMHSGFEASAVRELGKSPKDLVTMAKWNLVG